MQKHLLYINLFAITSALALTACADEVVNAITPDMPEVGEKTPIELSVGGVDAPSSALTRAVVTDNPYNPQNFTQKTTINFVMKSDKVGGTDAHYCVTRGVLDPSVNANVVDFGENTRYWDDTFARGAAVSIWAYTAQGTNWGSFAVGGKTAVSNWGTDVINPTIETWKVSDNSILGIQNETTIKNQDLIFSNNIVNYVGNENVPSASRNDKRLKFSNTTTGKFDKADLKFYHAMSKITVNLVEGKGFESAPFAITTATDIATPANGNVIINDMNMIGTFDIAKGEFTAISDNTTAISQMWNTTSSVQTIDGKKTWTLQALAIPNINSSSAKSAFKKDDNTIMMRFGIDNNVYNVTQAVLFSALYGKDKATTVTGTPDYIPLEAGKNYVFTFVIGKKQVENITAQVAEWETVIAEDVEPSNARIKLNLEERGSNIATNSVFSFFRATSDYNETAINDNYTKYDWKTGYVDSGDGKVKTAPSYETDHWTTPWFWESNKHFYHFRALGIADSSNPIKLSQPSGISTSDGFDYINITSAKNYEDLCWGAPFKDVEPGNDTDDHENLKWNYGPETNGFDGSDEINFNDEANAGKHQIYKAIGPTEDPVKLILFHMMSDLTINIKTTDGTEKVKLVDTTDPENPKYTTVEIVGFYPTGKVLLGNGLVQTTGATGTTGADGIHAITRDSETSGTHVYKFGAVPQNLATTVNDNAGVQLRITTPDNNQYIVDLSKVAIAIDSDNKDKITSNNIANPYKKIPAGQPNAGKYQIDRWYPGFKYEYSFTLKKTGITNLEATILEWEKVEAENEDVQIK